MRTAVFIIHRSGQSPEIRYGKASDIRADYRRAKLEGIPGADSCEVWESDRGRIRRRTFKNGVPVEAAEETAEAIVADATEAQPAKRGPGRPKKLITT